MDKTVILGQLQQLTGSLKPAPGTSADELSTLQRSLAEQLAADPGFSISGSGRQHETAQVEAAVDLTARFSHVSDLLTVTPAAQATAPAPLVFRRETVSAATCWATQFPNGDREWLPTKPSDPSSMSTACRCGLISFIRRGWCRWFRRAVPRPFFWCRCGARSPGGSRTASKPGAPGSPPA